NQADALEMVLDHGANIGHYGRHETAAGLEVATLGVKHRLQFLGQKGDIAALPERRRHHSCQGHNPLEVVHVLGVDEYLERPSLLVLGSGIEHNVVDGDIQSTVIPRGADLV